MTAATLKKEVTKARPPIVVVIGHVDHGKTTLLDTIRERQEGEEGHTKKVAAGESGGITQHVGAYEVTRGEKRITFIDTPGHEAFSAMRARGTDVADIALVVIAADDGVKPQTEEVLRYIKETDIPHIVVINKMDLPDADIEKVKNQLLELEVFVEDRGGEIPTVAVSAKTGENLEELLDMILLVAELEELTFYPTDNAKGYVIESNLDPKRGVVTNIVVTNGTLREGDMLVCGPSRGKVKAMEDDTGKKIKGAVPSMPVKVMGLDDLTVSGDPCRRVELEKEAQKEIEKNKQIILERKEKLLIKPDNQGKKLSIIVKADVQGSLEALVDTLRSIKSSRVGLNIVRCEVGDVAEDDIKFAEATNAAVFAFHTGVTKEADARAEQKNIPIYTHEVIYELVEKVREEMSYLLEPEVKRQILGSLEVLAIFRTEQNRMIVGGKVFKGAFEQGAHLIVERDEEKIGEGKIVKLQLGESKKERIKAPDEAGIEFEGSMRIKEGDILTAYKEEKTHPTLNE